MAGRADRSHFWGFVTLGLICLGVVAIVSLRTFAVQTYRSSSGSMEPTPLVGDFFTVSKSAYGYTRYSFPCSVRLFEGRILASPPRPGDVVVFRAPSQDIDYVERIVGLPGDRIQMRGGLGDNRDNSVDSRMPYGIGYIQAENLIGRVTTIIYSVNEDLKPRTDRIGLAVK